MMLDVIVTWAAFSSLNSNSSNTKSSLLYKKFHWPDFFSLLVVVDAVTEGAKEVTVGDTCVPRVSEDDTDDGENEGRIDVELEPMKNGFEEFIVDGLKGISNSVSKITTSLFINSRNQEKYNSCRSSCKQRDLFCVTNCSPLPAS